MKSPVLSIILRFAAARAGTSAVEFALLSPLYFLLMFGMAAYGIYFGASHSVQQLAADAARVAVAGLSATERQSLASDFVARNASTYAFVDGARIGVTVADNPTDTSQFVIALTYDARGLPIWNLFHGLPLPDMTIARRSTIRIGGI
jgi:Flp pilus assembly protein TadG